jgi:hypothetical protein
MGVAGDCGSGCQAHSWAFGGQRRLKPPPNGARDNQRATKNGHTLADGWRRFYASVGVPSGGVEG